jgi:hypothetical protein
MSAMDALPPALAGMNGLHAPPPHVPPRQLLLQPPQCDASVWKSTHVPPQLVQLDEEERMELDELVVVMELDSGVVELAEVVVLEPLAGVVLEPLAGVVLEPLAGVVLEPLAGVVVDDGSEVGVDLRVVSLPDVLRDVLEDEDSGVDSWELPCELAVGWLVVSVPPSGIGGSVTPRMASHAVRLVTTSAVASGAWSHGIVRRRRIRTSPTVQAPLPEVRREGALAASPYRTPAVHPSQDFEER